MSRLIDTELGQFRQVMDGQQERFLFECPTCHEMLPLTEAHLAGKAPVDHESRTIGATFCPFGGCHDFGRVLVSTMQAAVLMGYQPYHDEGQDRWQPSRHGGVDGVL